MKNTEQYVLRAILPLLDKLAPLDETEMIRFRESSGWAKESSILRFGSLAELKGFLSSAARRLRTGLLVQNWALLPGKPEAPTGAVKIECYPADGSFLSFLTAKTRDDAYLGFGHKLVTQDGWANSDRCRIVVPSVEALRQSMIQWLSTAAQPQIAELPTSVRNDLDLIGGVMWDATGACKSGRDVHRKTITLSQVGRGLSKLASDFDKTSWYRGLKSVYAPSQIRTFQSTLQEVSALARSLERDSPPEKPIRESASPFASFLNSLRGQHRSLGRAQKPQAVSDSDMEPDLQIDRDMFCQWASSLGWPQAVPVEQCLETLAKPSPRSHPIYSSWLALGASSAAQRLLHKYYNNAETWQEFAFSAARDTGCPYEHLMPIYVFLNQVSPPVRPATFKKKVEEGCYDESRLLDPSRVLQTC